MRFEIQNYLTLLDTCDEEYILKKQFEKFFRDQVSIHFGQWLFYKLICNPLNFRQFIALYKSGFLVEQIYEFKNADRLVQDKKYGTNLIEHTALTCLAAQDILLYIPVNEFWDNIGLSLLEIKDILYFAALLHDLGKIEALEGHENIGAILGKDICLKFEDFVIVKNLSTIVPILIKNHMRPLNYQRMDEKWTDKAFEKFILDSKGKPLAILTIYLSMMDKYSSSRNLRYLGPLVEFLKIINKFGNK